MSAVADIGSEHCPASSLLAVSCSGDLQQTVIAHGHAELLRHRTLPGYCG
jgi:hypothetical protein